MRVKSLLYIQEHQPNYSQRYSFANQMYLDEVSGAYSHNNSLPFLSEKYRGFGSARCGIALRRAASGSYSN